MKFSSVFFAKNLKNWRESLDLSQDEFAALFDTLKAKSQPRAVISSYETKESVPKLDFIFEVSEKSKISLDLLFSMEIDFEDGKPQLDTVIVREPKEPSSYQPDELSRLQNLVSNLSESLSNVSKLVNEVPALRMKIEALEREIKDLKNKKA